MHFISKKSRNLKALQSWKPVTDLVWCSIRRPLMEYFPSHSTAEGGDSNRQYPALTKAVDWMVYIKRTEAKHSTTPKGFLSLFPMSLLSFSYFCFSRWSVCPQAATNNNNIYSSFLQVKILLSFKHFCGGLCSEKNGLLHMRYIS